MPLIFLFFININPPTKPVDSRQWAPSLRQTHVDSDIKRFPFVKQLTAFEGLDSSVYESGTFNANQNRISKCFYAMSPELSSGTELPIKNYTSPAFLPKELFLVLQILASHIVSVLECSQDHNRVV
ncbi:IS110 family transposase [Paenibacillus sp. DMB20]|uniref:IS110 family transposase n=1 Tax=Paenibacillus sp. DMB20 TaxID=1642570 RepID=UPI001F1A9476|nr:IS110 family transposase [Paenibacillus sp. DMB20]